MHLFKDSDREDEIVWYVAPPGAKVHPHPGMFTSRAWEPDKVTAWPAVGEVQDAAKTWRKGAAPDVYLGRCFTGEVDWFLRGAPVAMLGRKPTEQKCCRGIEGPALLMNAEASMLDYRHPQKVALLLAADGVMSDYRSGPIPTTCCPDGLPRTLYVTFDGVLSEIGTVDVHWLSGTRWFHLPLNTVFACGHVGDVWFDGNGCTVNYGGPDTPEVYVCAVSGSCSPVSLAGSDTVSGPDCPGVAGVVVTDTHP